MCKRYALILLTAGACFLSGTTRAERVVYVDSLDLSGGYAGMGKRIQVRRSVDGNPLRMRGVAYDHGFGTHPESAVAFRLNGKVAEFKATVGVDDDAKDVRPAGDWVAEARFRVWADGKIVWRNESVMQNQQPVEVAVALDGVREVVLETSSGGLWKGFEKTNADWANARFVCGDNAAVEPIKDPALVAQSGILTPPENESPQFNGADIWGVRPGHPVIFRLAVSGVRPMRFSAKDLPAGVMLDAEKGILGGVAPRTPGNYDIELAAENGKGAAKRTIRLAVGETLALTPPMGWNSWNIWGPDFNGEHARTAARALVDSGLADHGWAYVNLDDFWEMNNSENCKRPELRGAARDENGMIRSNPSFPDMRGMTDFIHSLGLKAGLYSSPGPTTCGGCEGSWGHEMQDATRWAEWGFDYVKYDWCSYDKVLTDDGRRGENWWDDAKWMTARSDGKERPFRLMGDCLKRQNRDIVFSLCQYGIGRTQEWGREAGGNCWRTFDDMKDCWAWMDQAIDSRINGEYWRFSGPGFWADPDMMIVGLQDCFGSIHPTFLTPNEQYVHVSVWAMIGSPLLIGCDLTRLDAFTRSLLVNDMVIAISQDRLGKVAKRIRHDDLADVWVRPLSGGDMAVGLVNRYPLAREISVPFSDLGISGSWYARDCWTHACLGQWSDRFVALVPPHGIKLIRMKRPPCPKCPGKGGI